MIFGGALTGCTFKGCAFTGCALTGYALTGCALTGCSLTNCALTAINHYHVKASLNWRKSLAERRKSDAYFHRQALPALAVVK